MLKNLKGSKEFMEKAAVIFAEFDKDVLRVEEQWLVIKAQTPEWAIAVQAGIAFSEINHSLLQAIKSLMDIACDINDLEAMRSVNAFAEYMMNNFSDFIGGITKQNSKETV